MLNCWFNFQYLQGLHFRSNTRLNLEEFVEFVILMYFVAKKFFHSQNISWSHVECRYKLQIDQGSPCKFRGVTMKIRHVARSNSREEMEFAHGIMEQMR
jgi:hypothetical protein